MTTSTTTPSIPLPTGAVCADLWQDTDHRPWRRITGEVRGVTGGNTNVSCWAEAVQYADGSLDQSAIDRPSVQVEANQEALSARQARELADALLAAADELDGWAER
ncbi:hypothetical protein PJM27_08940 [Mycobacterium kansasii]